jgi:hypothetical protein
LLALTGEIGEARRLALATRAATSPDLFTCEVLWRRGSPSSPHPTVGYARRCGMTFHAQTPERPPPWYMAAELSGTPTLARRGS